MRILITGAAGFIGSHVSRRLLSSGHIVIGVDNLNDYYSVDLKRDRIAGIKDYGYNFLNMDISDKTVMSRLFRNNKFDVVINLASQAGVRYSLVNPQAFINSNLIGFFNILEGCKTSGVKHLIYASSSSVYGNGNAMPFSVGDFTDNPISLYAATKKSNEVMAHAYYNLYGIKCTGLRFFTVYGPWGRPDMAYYSFTRNIIHDGPIDVFNNGKMMRDFTYIDDVVDAVSRVVNEGPIEDYKIYNVGNNKPEELLDFIAEIERNVGKKANIKFLDMQPGDVRLTYADIGPMMTDYGWKPLVGMEEGINKFVSWYKDYHKV